MRYLVTGGAGFIGSHLVERLLRDGDDVVVVDDLSTGRIAHLRAVHGNPRFRFVEGDVADADLVAALVAEVDAVAHLAATVGVARVVERSSYALAAGLRGVLSVLSAAAPRRTPTLVASSSEVYGTNPDMPLDEDADLVLGPPSVPRWTYAASKVAAEMLAQSFHRERSVPTIVVRLFNTVGPRQRSPSGMVLPRFVAQALDGRALTVYGDGRQTRCFCDVADVVEALAALLHEPRARGQVVNVGGIEEVRIGELAELVVRRTASASSIRKLPYEDVYGPDFGEPRRRVPDITRVGRLIGWNPTRTLREMVDLVIADTRGVG